MTILKNELFIKELNECLMVIDDIMANAKGIFKGFQIDEDTNIPLVLFNDPQTKTTLALAMNELSEDSVVSAIGDSRKEFLVKHF